MGLRMIRRFVKLSSLSSTCSMFIHCVVNRCILAEVKNSEFNLTIYTHLVVSSLSTDLD